MKIVKHLNNHFLTGIQLYPLFGLPVITNEERSMYKLVVDKFVYNKEETYESKNS